MVARIPVNNNMAWNEVWSALFHFWRERTSCIKPIKWTLQLSKLKKKNRIHPHYGGVVRCLCPQSAITAKKTTRKEIECSAIVMRALLNKRTSWLKGNNFSHRITCDMNFERWKLYTIPIVLKCSFKYFPHIVCVCVFFFHSMSAVPWLNRRPIANSVGFFPMPVSLQYRFAYTKIDLFISWSCYSCSSPFSSCSTPCQ